MYSAADTGKQDLAFILSVDPSMARHFLLSAAARSLSAAKIMRMSDRGVENVFLRLRWRLARKLAVILHRMWADGSEFRWGKQASASTAAA